jgi:hypothetical protein
MYVEQPGTVGEAVLLGRATLPWMISGIWHVAMHCGWHGLGVQTLQWEGKGAIQGMAHMEDVKDGRV